MSQGLLDADPLVRVERQHLVEEVERLGVGIREQLGPRHFGLEWQRLEVASRLQSENKCN